MNTEEILLNNSKPFYVPIATTSSEGIASFYEQHFDVVNGQVNIKRNYFHNLLSTGIERLRLNNTYNNHYFISELYGLSGSVVSTSKTKLPFDEYVRDVNVSKQGNVVKFELSNETGLLGEREFNLSDYANKIVSARNGNSLSFTLYNGSKVLSASDINLSDYANSLLITKEGNDITFDLRNDVSTLQKNTVTLSEYAKSINIVRNNDTLTFYLKNGSEVLSSCDVNITDSTNVKDCKLEFSLDTTNYVMTAYLKDKSNNIITQTSVDFPLESVVVGATENNGTITLQLQNGQSVSLYIGDIVNGLVSQTLYDKDKSYLLNELYDIKTQLGSYVNTVDSLIGEVV